MKNCKENMEEDRAVIESTNINKNQEEHDNEIDKININKNKVEIAINIVKTGYSPFSGLTDQCLSWVDIRWKSALGLFQKIQ